LGAIRVREFWAAALSGEGFRDSGLEITVLGECRDLELRVTVCG